MSMSFNSSMRGTPYNIVSDTDLWGVIHFTTRRDLVGKGGIIREIKELRGFKIYI
jgi:hypothetical protein